MAAFELEQNRLRDRNNVSNVEQVESVDTRRLKQECIIALKVYDQCRHLYCKIHHFVAVT